MVPFSLRYSLLPRLLSSSTVLSRSMYSDIVILLSIEPLPQFVSARNTQLIVHAIYSCLNHPHTCIGYGAWRVYLRSAAVTHSLCCHHSTSCDQNSRLQERQFLYRAQSHLPSYKLFGHTFTVPVERSASGNRFKNTLCRVLRGCAADHFSTIAT